MKLIKISKLVKLRVYIKFVFWESIVYRNYLENIKNSVIFFVFFIIIST